MRGVVQLKEAHRGLARDDYYGQARFARALVVAQAGEPLVLKILFRRDEDERRRARVARGNRLPAHVRVARAP